MLYETNWLAIVLALIASIVLGMLWYGPLFGKKWMKLQGYSQKQINNAKMKEMTSVYIIMTISSLLTVYIFGFLMSLVGTIGVIGGVMLGFWVWLGFIATYSTGSVLWEGKPWELWFLNNSYQFIIFLLVGA